MSAGSGKTGSLTYEALMAAKEAIDALPREPWMHTRKVDDRWEVLDNGLAPPAWRELSNSSRLFAIDLHVGIEEGDRFVVGESIYVVNAERQMVPMEHIGANPLPASLDGGEER